MTAITNEIASDRDIIVWIVEETTAGVLVPPAAENIVGAFEISYPMQKPEYENSKEKNATRDVINRCQSSMPGGEWSFSTYCRPDGLGNPPGERLLMKAAAGLETIQTGVDVVYDPAIKKIPVSLWFLVDHTMLFASGGTVGGMEVNIEDCSLTFIWSGGLMVMGVCGTDPLAALVAPAAEAVIVTDIDKFTEGAQFVLTDAAGVVVDDNAGAGYKVTNVTEQTSTLTIEPPIAIGAAADGFIAPFNPGGTLPGNPLETRTANLNLSGETFPVVDFKFTLADEPEYLEREKTPSGYPENYAEIQRETTGEIALVFKRDEASRFKEAIRGDEVPATLVVGDSEGYIYQLHLPRIKSDVPTISEEEPIVEITMEFTALGVNGEDSFKSTYK